MTHVPGSPSRRRSAAAASLAVVIALPIAAPDLVPPGRKKVHNEALLDWGDTPREQRFVAYPTQRGVCIEVHPGEAFSIAGPYATRIYAVPAGAELPTAKAPLPDDCPWPSTKVPVRTIWSTGEANPLARIVSTVRVLAVHPDGIDLACTGERRLDAHGNELGDFEWVPLAAIAAAGAILVYRLARRAPTTAEDT